jgi:hypothetical protein
MTAVTIDPCILLPVTADAKSHGKILHFFHPVHGFNISMTAAAIHIFVHMHCMVEIDKIRKLFFYPVPG